MKFDKLFGILCFVLMFLGFIYFIFGFWNIQESKFGWYSWEMFLGAVAMGFSGTSLWLQEIQLKINKLEGN